MARFAINFPQNISLESSETTEKLITTEWTRINRTEPLKGNVHSIRKKRNPLKAPLGRLLQGVDS